MSQPSEEIVFDGTNGLSCGGFIRAIRLRALARENQDNDKWVAQYAAAHIDGSALQWYEELNDETQESWKLLRRALLAQWPTDQPPSASQGGFVEPPQDSITPTPAAAPPPSISAGVPLSSSPKIGRIRVFRDDNVHFGWISRYPDKDGDYRASPDISDAMIVQVTSEDTPHNIKFMSYPTNDQWLGVIWSHQQDVEADLSQDKARWGTLVALRGIPSAVLSSPSPHLGPSRAAIWNVLLDGTLLITWTGKGTARYNVGVALATAGGKDHGVILLCTGYEKVTETYETFWKLDLRKARLVFEPR